MQKTEYERFADKGAMELNTMFNNRDSFIKRELEKLERLADKMSSIPEHLRHIAFSSLEEDVKEALQEHSKWENRFAELN